MADKKTITASALVGAGIVTAIFLIAIFGQAGDNPVGYCESTKEFCIAVDGFSGGSKTRCYNETDMNWWEAPYCSEGWIEVSNDLDIKEPENETNETKEEVNPKEFSGTVWDCNSNKCVKRE